MLPLLVMTVACASPCQPVAAPPIYLWFEPEWFTGVEGGYTYWTGTSKPTGKWGIAGPGISAEWTQGGESEWNSIGVPAEETKAECHRDLVVPRAGKYRIWIRYVDHRKKQTPFKVALESNSRRVGGAELGVIPVVPVNDEYQLYWGFSFGWGSFDAELPAGKMRLRLQIDRAGQAWRQIDAILLTTDLDHVPVGREKPPFDYLRAMSLRPASGTPWRGKGVSASQPARPAIAGRDFSMWAGIDGATSAWKDPAARKRSLAEAFYALASPPDIRKAFNETYRDVSKTPLIHSPLLLPGFYLGQSPDLSSGSPLREWLVRTKAPFYILTNYAAPRYDDKSGPATYAALTGPLEKQFLGYIHGEALGTVGVNTPSKPLGKTRAEHLIGMRQHLLEAQSSEWSKFYKTTVPPAHRTRSIPCLSVEGTALAHLFYDMGSRIVGYEVDSTMVHVPMRIAFQRGAARQFEGAWINYASGNFGDACNYFTQDPRVPRGAKAWYHSKYAITDGVSASWYRKLYYLNYLSGANAIYWEQNLENQWLLPGPGTHRVQLSPFGRCTEEFMDCVARVGDRGDPLTPIAFLLDTAHGYEPVTYHGKMLNHFPQTPADIELRELFNVAWYPSAISEGKPAAPDVQSLPGGVHGNIFDVLVDHPKRSKAIHAYPVVWLAGDVELKAPWPTALTEYVEKGGTLVVNLASASKLPARLLGLELTSARTIADRWKPVDGESRAAVPFEVAGARLKGASPLIVTGDSVPIVTRHTVGKGAVITTLIPGMVGQDERAHPVLAYLMNGVTDGLVPISVRRKDGGRLNGEILYQVNRTKDGYLVLLMNTRGIDKTQHGIARVDRRQVVDLVLETSVSIDQAQEHTQPRSLEIDRKGMQQRISVQIHPGDVQVVHLREKR